LFSAVSGLPPFGFWKVNSYRYASGEPPDNGDPPELKSLVGSNVRLNLDRLQAGNVLCSAPVFDAWTITNEDFRKRFGIPISSLGITTDNLEGILLSCDRRSELPTQTFLLRLPDDHAVMLWEGVFLELERIKMSFPP
jgi:hypothetical protein